MIATQNVTKTAAEEGRALGLDSERRLGAEQTAPSRLEQHPSAAHRQRTTKRMRLSLMQMLLLLHRLLLLLLLRLLLLVLLLLLLLCSGRVRSRLGQRSAPLSMHALVAAVRGQVGLLELHLADATKEDLAARGAGQGGRRAASKEEANVSAQLSDMWCKIEPTLNEYIHARMPAPPHPASLGPAIPPSVRTAFSVSGSIFATSAKAAVSA